MGRKRNRGGGLQVEQAEQLFRESGDFRYVALAIGKHPLDPPKWAMAACTEQIDRVEGLFRESDDFRYVAMAIGSCPLDPPRWAILECIELRLKSETVSALGETVTHIDEILDRTVLCLAEYRAEQFAKCAAIADRSDRAACIADIKKMALTSAFKKAIQYVDPSLMENRNEQLSSALDNLKKAWRREQIEELVDWEAAGLEPDGAFLEGFATTHRIERVMSEFFQPEYFDVDLQIWIAKELGVNIT